MKIFKRIADYIYYILGLVLLTLFIRHRFFDGYLYFFQNEIGRIEIPFYFIAGLYLVFRGAILIFSSKENRLVWVLGILSALLYWYEFIMEIISEER